MLNSSQEEIVYFVSQNKNITSYVQEMDKNEILIDIPEDNTCQLRVSLTQLCNEKCFFCHNEGNEKDFVTFNEEIFLKTLHVMSKNNIFQRIRFTGGEPLLYKNIGDLIVKTKKIIPKANIGLTTNGLLLERKAKELVESGLDKITISLHSLNDDKYEEITGVRGLKKVLRGLDAIRTNGFGGTISINSVIGTNNIQEVQSLDIFCKEYNYKLKLLDILPTENNLIPFVLSQKQIEEITLINKSKGERTQEKCTECEHESVCSGEAEYLRMSPSGVLNPCLSMKEFDIDLSQIEKEETFEKAVLLGFRRVKNLTL